MLRKWIPFVLSHYIVWTTDSQIMHSTEVYSSSSSYRPKSQVPQQYTQPSCFLPFLHTVQLLWDTAIFNVNCIFCSKSAYMKTWHFNTRKNKIQRNVQLQHLYDKQKHGRQFIKLYCQFLTKIRINTYIAQSSIWAKRQNLQFQMHSRV